MGNGLDDYFASFGAGDDNENVTSQIDAVVKRHGTITCFHEGASGQHRILLPLYHGERGRFAHVLAQNYEVYVRMCEYQIRYALCLADIHDSLQHEGIKHSIEGFTAGALVEFKQLKQEPNASNQIVAIIDSMRSNIPAGIRELTEKRSIPDRAIFFNGMNAWNVCFAMLHKKNQANAIVPGRIDNQMVVERMHSALKARSINASDLTEQEYEEFIRHWQQEYIDDYTARHTNMKQQLGNAAIGTVSLGSAHFMQRVQSERLPIIENEFTDDTMWVVELDPDNSVHTAISDLGLKNTLFPFTTTKHIVNSALKSYRQH